MRYQGVVFDLDGTLLDTLKDMADSMNFVLAGHGCPTHETAAYRQFIGHGILVLARRALPADTPEETVLRVRDEYERRYSAHFMDATRPFDGIPGMLESLKKAGLRLAVVSNKPDPDTRALTRTLLGDFFDYVQGQRPDLPKKPDPHAPLLAAAAMGLPPARVAYVGDSGVDMETARNAGMDALGVTWGFRGREELIARGALALFDDAASLLRALTAEA